MKLVNQIDAEIRLVEDERAAAREALDRAKAEWRETDKAFGRRLTQLRRARGYVSGDGVTNGSNKAGQAAVDKVAMFIKDRGQATQAEVVKETGIGSGQISYAVRTLEAKGVLRDTGERVGRSRKFEYVEEVA